MLSTFTVLIDANVFYGARLRSLMVEFAQTGLVRARWSDDIHDEWIAALLRRRPDLKFEDLGATRRSMDAVHLRSVRLG